MTSQASALISLQLQKLTEDTARRLGAVAITSVVALFYLQPHVMVAYCLLYWVCDLATVYALTRLSQNPQSGVWLRLVQLAAFNNMSMFLVLVVLLWLEPGVIPKIAGVLYTLGGMLSLMLVRAVYLPMTIPNSLPIAGVVLVIWWIERASLPLAEQLFLAIAFLIFGAYFTITVMATQRSITDLWRARDEALARAETQKRFLATMSHELRTPLNGIMGIAQSIAADHPGLGADKICDNARDMAAMVDDLLDNAAIEAGALRIRPEPTALADVLGRVDQRWRSDFVARGLDLVLVQEKGLPATVLIDQMRVAQCLSNLIGNALRMTQKGSVTLTLRPHPKGLEAVVTDTGPGLPAGVEHRLFRPFDSLDPKGGAGTGLGLSICRGLALAMGGDLTYSPVETGGCRFRLTLSAPAADAASVQAGLAMAAPDKALLVGKTLLVVDDIATNRLVLRLLLLDLKAQVNEAASGEDLVQQFADPSYVPPDAVLMDIRMPGLSGFETLAALRREGYQGPVIAVSADASPQDRDEAVACGFDGYLTKPVEAAALATVLSRAFSGDQRL